MDPRPLAAGALLLALASCGPPPRFATHGCFNGRVVHMPLSCVEADDTLADEPDQFAGIRAALVRLGRRTNGRPGETIAGLVQEYTRLDADLRQRYTAACRRWAEPCDPPGEAVYRDAVTEIRRRNARVRDLRAAVEELAGKTGWIEPGDDAAKGLLRQLEIAAEELEKP